MRVQINSYYSSGLIASFSCLLFQHVNGGSVESNDNSPAVHHPPTKTTPRSTSSSVFFATPPASLSVPADFTAGVLFSTDFLKEFYPGFGPTQTSVEPQPKITDPVVSSS